MKDIISEIMKEEGSLSECLPNYQVRDSQIQGVELILNSLQDKKDFILEGPCGYGKSATYLIPIILEIIRSKRKKRAIIVTGGITLQEQIFNKDLPVIIDAVKKVYNDSTSIYTSYLKGRNNFACKRKISEKEFELRNNTVLDLNGETESVINWANKTNLGDFSELDHTVSYDTLRKTACLDSNDCQGKNCSFNDVCFYQNRKKRSKACDIVVCNYHVLFSDLTLSEKGKILGEYDILICDEAHEMAKIARDFMQNKVSFYTFMNIQRNLSYLQNKHSDLFDIKHTGMSNLMRMAQFYFEQLTVDFNIGEYKRYQKIAKGTGIEYFLFEAIDKFKDATYRCLPDIENINYNTEKDDILDVYYTLARVLETVEKIKIDLKSICTQEPKDLVYWLEKENNNLLSLNSKPLKVNNFLNREIFNNENLSTVITSATLSVNNNFNFIKEELGVEKSNEETELIAPSPFNLKEQELWYLPKDAIEGNNREFSTKMIKHLLEIITATEGGALCLFTSNYNMNLATKKLREHFFDLNILKQGEKPRGILLEEFSKDKNSILVATKSFFKGVDIVGDSLRCLVVDKLPFESPDDPVMSTLSNESGGFFKYMIPDMVITLKQAVGRGVRSIDDKCIIAILDNRISTARYKNRINNSFNYPKTGTRDIKDVKDFIREKALHGKK